MRIAIGVEYDGTAYNGWQRQQNGAGIQEKLEAAIAVVADHEVELSCAGRTDAGVHASGQVAHFDTQSGRSDRGWLLGVNSLLPDDVNLTWVRRVDPAFHARYSATARSYRYLILNQLVRSALFRHRAWWVHEPLDTDTMHAAAQRLVGEHDFSAFRAAGCQASSPVREIRSIEVRREASWVVLDVTANAFLQHMVRNITGSLAAVGAGRCSGDWLADVLDSRDRRRAGVAAPPQGLTLTGVTYPQAYGLPAAGEPGETRAETH